MQWLEVTVNTAPDQLGKLEARLTALGVTGFITEDSDTVNQFLENNKKYWDYVDEDFLQRMQGVCRVKFYLEDTEAGREELLRLREALSEWELLTAAVRDEDWENNWRQYYKPIPVGRRLLIVPEWEAAPPAEERTVLRLDPGLIFGTGAHATTQLCLEALEDVVQPGCAVLDLGCGSGILAIASLLLGAGHAVGCDIDEKAPEVVMENAALNGIGPDRLSAFCGDVLSGGCVVGSGFDIVLSNIVADVIIALAERVPDFLAENGVWICSGVIEGREREVEDALAGQGFRVRSHTQREGWHAFVCERQ